MFNHKLIEKMTEIINKFRLYSLKEHNRIQNILRWTMIVLTIIWGILFYFDL